MSHWSCGASLMRINQPRGYPHYIPGMSFLRALLDRRLRRGVLAWFVLSMMASVASPMVHPQRIEMVCSSAGMLILVVQADDALIELGSTALDCPLCVVSGAPASAAAPKLPPAWSHAAPVCLSCTHLPLVATVVLPPPTGPPFFSFS